MVLNCAFINNTSTPHLSLIHLIKNHESLHLKTEYTDNLDVTNILEVLNVDIVFIYIEKSNSFDFLSGIKHKPQVICISDSSQYALKAFDYDATDYLKIPVNEARFNTAVQKALKKHRFEKKVINTSAYIFVKSNLKKRKVFVDDIKWIRALGDYVKVVTNNQSLVVLSTMKAFEDKLSNLQFLRIHKSYIVNLNKIDRVSAKTVELGSDMLPISRHKKKILTEVLNNI